jgi:microsomal dipeptidase-like Zn-dependent dipeptidase
MPDASSPAPADREATTQIADCHNDLLVDLAYHRGEPDRFRVNWLGHLRQGGVAVQVCPVSVELDQLPETALRRSLEQILAPTRSPPRIPRTCNSCRRATISTRP